MITYFLSSICLLAFEIMYYQAYLHVSNEVSDHKQDAIKYIEVTPIIGCKETPYGIGEFATENKQLS